MPQPIAETYVEIKYDSVTKAQGAVDKLGAAFGKASNEIDTRSQKISRAFIGIGSAIAGIGVAKLGSDIIGAATKMDNLNRMLINVEGSQKAANKRFEEFRVLAKEPILDPMNLSRFYVGLKSIGIEGEKSIRFMKSLANAMAGAGGSNEGFTRSMEQVVQMMGKGKLEGQDLRVILESFPSFAKYLKEAFGTINTEELAKQGISAIDVMTRLNEVMEKAPHFAGGAQAAQENFTQSLQLFYAALGKDILPKVTEFLNKLTALMDKFGQLDDSTKKTIGTAVVGGIGLLGVASAVGAITTALNLLGMSSGLKALTSVGVGVATAGKGVATAGAAAGMGIVPALGIAIATATITIGAGYLLGKGLADLIYGGRVDKAKILEQEILGTQTPETIALKKKILETQMTQGGYQAGDYVSGETMQAFKKENFILDPKSIVQQLYDQLSIGKGEFIEKPMKLTGGIPQTFEEFSKTYNISPFQPNPIWIRGGGSGYDYAKQGMGIFGQDIRSPGGAGYEPITGVRPSVTGTGPGMGIPSMDRTGLTSGLGLGSEISKRQQEIITSKNKEYEITLKIDKEIMGRWESEGIENQKISDSWLDMTDGMKTSIGDVGEEWINYVNLMNMGIDFLANKAQTFLDSLYGEPQTEGKTGGVEKGFWKFFSTAVEWITHKGAEYGIDYASNKLAMAEGGSGIVTKPTMFIAGEAGAERFSFQPLSKSGSGSGTFGNTTINVSIVIPNADINTITQSQIEKLTRDKIIPALQGAGRRGVGQPYVYG